MASEMLGNQYFLAKRYDSAARNFKETLLNDPQNKSVQKKLIICYLQIGNINKALDTFLELIKKDIDFVINTDLKEDVCPCPELIVKYGTLLPYENNSTDLRIILSILWLYCDAEKSYEFFKSLLDENIKKEKISQILKIIGNRLKSKQPNNIN
jgi:tetratricopeptide (TPR) repeat protein